MHCYIVKKDSVACFLELVGIVIRRAINICYFLLFFVTKGLLESLFNVYAIDPDRHPSLTIKYNHTHSNFSTTGYQSSLKYV